MYISTRSSYKSRPKCRKFRERESNIANNENPHRCSRVTRIIKNSKLIKFNARQHRSVHLKISKVKRRRYKKKEKNFKGATIAQSYHTVILDEILKPLESHELTMVILHELHIYIYIYSYLDEKNHSHQPKKKFYI